MNEDSIIHFFYEDCEEFKLKNPDAIANWISQIITNNKFCLYSLNYIFCSDEYLHKINLEYLDHDTYTDIITFDNSEEENTVEGDIYISIDRINENAAIHSADFLNELYRVVAHGVLHLLGYNDKTEDEKKQMREKEEACLSLCPL